MLKMLAFIFLGVPILGVILCLLPNNVDKSVSYLTIALYGLLFSVVTFREFKKMKEDNKKRKQDWEVKKVELRKKRAELSFKTCFGFDQKYISEKRYEKEVLMKLLFITIKMNEYSIKTVENSNPFSRMIYAEYFARYQHRIDLLEKASPEFVAKLPHWTELKSFIEKWSYENME